MIFQRRQKTLVWSERLSHIKLPTLISMTGPIAILGLLGGIFMFFHILIKILCEQTVKMLIRYRIMMCLIWFFVVCQCPIKGTL